MLTAAAALALVAASSAPAKARKQRAADPTGAIGTMLQYLQTNRDGAEPALLHGPAHLNDAVLVGGGPIDLTGGWMDAGDTIKFTQTIALVAGQLEASARLDPPLAPALTTESDVGIRWLVKAHPLGSSFFVAQVGDERDHNLGFRNPAFDDASRKPGIGVRLAFTGIGSDIAGKVAAALAMAADRNSAAAPKATLIALAREWYAAGKAVAAPVPFLPKPAVNGYPSTSWEDDMAAGAAALARTTGEGVFLSDAGAYLAASGSHYGFGWEDNNSFAAADLCGALGAASIADAGTRALGCGKLAEAAAIAALNSRRNGGLAGNLAWGSTGENGSFGAAAALAGKVGAAGDGIAVGSRARDWLLGANRWGASFITGFGPRSPRQLHHWATVFGRAKPTGAVVGGPAPPKQIKEQGFKLRGGKFKRFNSKRAAYEDRRSNYVTSEPAIDYTGASILLLASLGAG